MTYIAQYLLHMLYGKLCMDTRLLVYVGFPWRQNNVNSHLTNHCHHYWISILHVCVLTVGAMPSGTDKLNRLHHFDGRLNMKMTVAMLS